MTNLRTNHLMAQKVDVGIVFVDMLGMADGLAYLRDAGVPESVIERVLPHPGLRRAGARTPARHCASHDCPDNLLCSKQGACTRP